MEVLKKIYALALFFLIVGGIAWGYLGMRGKNPVSGSFGKYAWIIYGIVGLSAILVLALGRNAFFPFLGPTVFPCSALSDKVPENADTTIEIQVKPGAKVLYWAAEPSNNGLMNLKSWKDAYGSYQNVGIATANRNGIVKLSLRKPQPYNVPLKGRLESHVHYRICAEDGWMSQVETHIVSSEPIVKKEVRVVELFQQPKPKPPLRPVTQTPETPVIADPISGLPTAIPGTAAPIKKEPPMATAVAGARAETPSPIEGFINEPMFSVADGPSQMWAGTETVDPRLQRLRVAVETDAINIIDSMAQEIHAGFTGTDLDAAFQPTRLQTIRHSQP